jgi:hypothetical protein
LALHPLTKGDEPKALWQWINGFDRCGFDENVDADQDICKISLIGLILFSVGVDEIVVTSKFEIFREKRR